MAVNRRSCRKRCVCRKRSLGKETSSNDDECDIDGLSVIAVRRTEDTGEFSAAEYVVSE